MKVLDVWLNKCREKEMCEFTLKKEHSLVASDLVHIIHKTWFQVIRVKTLITKKLPLLL